MKIDSMVRRQMNKICQVNVHLTAENSIVDRKTVSIFFRTYLAVSNALGRRDVERKVDFDLFDEADK
jgi:hypothetical protein